MRVLYLFVFSLLIGLTTNGSLLVICPYTLLPILHWTNTVITDFVVTNDEETSLLIFTKHPKCQFQLIVIPGLCVIRLYTSFYGL